VIAAMENPDSDRFFAGAIHRIETVLAVLTAAASIAIWMRYGRATALGFGAGALLAWLNFRWLERGVAGLAERIVDAQSQERGRSVVMRFLLRYLLVGVVAYAIFRGSAQTFRAFLFGLCLPVAAMLVEAMYEAWVALYRGY
jgi:hypothetical protein